MNFKKGYLLYTVIIGAFALLIWFILDQGEKLTPTLSLQMPQRSSSASLLTEILQHAQQPLGMLLFQIILILCVSRFFGFLARKVRQPAVVGEVIAGIALGPSLFGWIFPETMQTIFPASTLPSLQLLSQIGLAFFMFIVGMELDLEKVRKKAGDAVMISHASIVIPFFLGVCLAYFAYQRYAPTHIGFVSFALFMGIAMSITAFPVLARIVQERGLTGTPLGSMAITCAAADDITAWGILAIVVAIVKSGGLMSAFFTIILAIIFVLCMLIGVRPWLKRKMNTMTSIKTKVALGFFILLASGYFAEIIGIHLLFGAFLAGVIMPTKGGIRSELQHRLEDVSIVMLLPIFFVITGLRTQIGLLNEGHLWIMFALIMLVAVSGKFAGSAITARIIGLSWREALSIGALMNTRGLMELVVLNIGYDLGILTPQVFAMMVLMALATTFMTGPLLDLIHYAAENSRKK